MDQKRTLGDALDAWLRAIKDRIAVVRVGAPWCTAITSDTREFR